MAGVKGVEMDPKGDNSDEQMDGLGENAGISESQKAPDCLFPGCTNSAIPGSEFCGDTHTHLTGVPDNTQTDFNPGDDGTLTASAAQMSGMQDGTTRYGRVNPELRAVSAKNGIVTVEGYAIRYEAPYQVNDLYGSFTETMKRGAARNVLTGDTRFLVNHDGVARHAPPITR